MIDSFKDIVLEYFISQNKEIKRENIVIIFYEEIKDNIIRAFLKTTLPDFEYYEIMYNGFTEEFSLNVYQKIKNCRIIKDDK